MTLDVSTLRALAMSIDELPLEFIHSHADLLADPAPFAVEAARQLFARFHRDIPENRLDITSTELAQQIVHNSQQDRTQGIR